MKKWIALVLVAVMVLGLCACSPKIDEETQKKLDLYAKYEKLISLLEEDDYEAAYYHLLEMYHSDKGDNEGSENEEGDGEEPTDPPRPTEEDRKVLDQYRELTNRLLSYMNGNGIYVYDENDQYLEGSAALAEIYAKLNALDATVLEKWSGSEYVNYTDSNGNPVNWDISFYLDGFNKLENVLLKENNTRIDNMENVENISSPVYYYNEDGTIAYISYEGKCFELIETNPWDLHGTREYIYDDSGKVIKIKYKDGDTVNYIVDLTYDENGNVINEHIKQNSGEVDITYEYDEQNRLLKIELPASMGSDRTKTYYYFYDENGNMIKEEIVEHETRNWQEVDYDVIDYKYIREFVYDSNGALLSGSYEEEHWYWSYSYGDSVFKNYADRETVNRYEFTSDAQGRPLTMVITYGDNVYIAGEHEGEIYSTSSYVSKTTEFIYGDYWFFNPDK